jgi:hypothetical protein
MIEALRTRELSGSSVCNLHSVQYPEGSKVLRLCRIEEKKLRLGRKSC